MALTDLTLRLPDLEAPSATGASWTNAYPYPSFELPSGTVTVRTNLYPRPFPDSSGTVGFATSAAGTTLANESVEVHDRPRSVKVTTDGATAFQGVLAQGGYRPASAVAGQEVHSAWVKAPLGAVMEAQMQEYLPAGSWVGNRATENFVGTGTWQRVSATGNKATAGNVTSLLVQTRSGFPQAITFYVTEWMAEVGSVLYDYFDWLTPDTGDFEYLATGTENNSTSIMRAKGILDGGGDNSSVSYQSQEWAAEGDSSLRITPNTSAASSFRNLGNITVVPGDVWTMVAKVRLAAPQIGTLHPSARRITARFAQGSEEYQSDPAPNVAGEHELRLTFTVPPGRTQLTPRLYNGASAGNGDVWYDVVTIVPGVYTGPPFTGSSDITGYETAWLGAINESASTLTELIPGSPPLQEVTRWSITEPGTPHNIARSTGSTGVASITAKANEDTFWTISEDATITVDGLEGSFEGTIDSTRIQPFNEHGDPSGATTFSVASVLNLLNAERTLPPVIEKPLSEVIQGYVAAVTPNLNITWLAFDDPIRTYGAWSGNVWDILKTVCAANKLETALSGSTVLVRDLGTQIIRFDDPAHPGFDIENVSLSVTPGSGQYVEITYRDSTAINNQVTYNYVGNPSVEVNATGYGVDIRGFGSVTGSRVSN